MSFAAATLLGIVADNSPATVIWRATLTMIVCWFIGQVIGGIAQRAVNEKIAAYKNAHPMPSIDDAGGAEQHTTSARQDAAPPSGVAS